MRASELAAVEARLEAFLEDVTGFMGRRDRRAWAGAYMRGLLLDGERKSAEPMATRLGKSKQGLQQFVSQSPWPAQVLLEGLVAREARRQAPAYWIIDETSFPKAGKHSVGVARQYCGALGKLANCQVAVSLPRAGERAGASRPLSWRLYLPEAWSEDPTRRLTAGIPAAVVHQSKTDLALSVIDEALDWGTLSPAWCLPTRRMAAVLRPSWWPRPRRSGASSRRTTANPRGNSASITSRAAPGRAGSTTSPRSAPPSPSCARNNAAAGGTQTKAAAHLAGNAPAPPGRAGSLERPMSLVPNPL